MSRQSRNNTYVKIHKLAKEEGTLQPAMRELCLNDLFYLLTRACARKDVDNDWLYERCLEVQRDPDGYLDLWAREHYKSTIITFGKTIQDILTNPEITVGIFSHTKPIARGFLRQIKFEFENNNRLKQLFPEILYEEPKRESSNWSEDKGITVKRKSNPAAATVEAHGLVDGQPTGKHFSLLIYDDVVTRESVTSPDMIKKTTDALSLSYNLGAHGGRRRYIGTRYHHNDTYREIISRESAVKRVHPATKDGKADGEPVFLERDVLVKKRKDMGVYVFGCQMLQDPKADQTEGFKEDWLRYWDVKGWQDMNRYILVDPAGGKRKLNDYTSMFVIGCGYDKNYYVIDMVRDKLNLTERARTLFQLHETYTPVGVGYEKYGMQADIEHIEYEQELKNYRFEITPLGGQTPKIDRIKRLVPLFEYSRVYLPKRLTKPDFEGTPQELVSIFIDEEFKPFPVMVHDDMLDCLARIQHPEFVMDFPSAKDSENVIIPGGMSLESGAAF